MDITRQGKVGITLSYTASVISTGYFACRVYTLVINFTVQMLRACLYSKSYFNKKALMAMAHDNDVA